MGVDAVMFVAVDQALDAAEVKALGYRLCAAVGKSRFMVFRPGEYGSSGTRAVEVVTGEDVPDSLGEDVPPAQVLELNLSGRYWGPGYERGDLLFYLGLADLLDAVLPGCRVYYGGDSSMRVTLLDAGYRAELLRHLAGDGGARYHQRSATYRGDAAPVCGFCAQSMSNSGGQGSTSFWDCLGCSLKAVTRPGERPRVCVERLDRPGSAWDWDAATDDPAAFDTAAHPDAFERVPDPEPADDGGREQLVRAAEGALAKLRGG